MVAGRPPKPLELKRLQGNPGKRPLPAKTETIALEPATGVPAPITLGPNGRDIWQRAQKAASWLSELDLMALEDLCETWDEVCELRRVIIEDGFTLEEPIVTPAGYVVGARKVPHPLLKDLRNAQKQLHATAGMLGFNPSARARLGIAEVKFRSKLEELRIQRDGVS